MFVVFVFVYVVMLPVYRDCVFLITFVCFKFLFLRVFVFVLRLCFVLRCVKLRCCCAFVV